MSQLNYILSLRLIPTLLIWSVVCVIQYAANPEMEFIILIQYGSQTNRRHCVVTDVYKTKVLIKSEEQK